MRRSVPTYDTVHGDHSLGSLGPERHPVIDINRAAWWRRARQKFFLLRGHRWPSCQINTPKSGQVLVRTHGQGWERRFLSWIPRLKCVEANSTARFRRRLAFCQSEKADRFWSAPMAKVGSGYFCPGLDRKSTRLNSSHLGISYAVFC